MLRKEDFEWVWKDSSVYDILNQFYYEHMELQKATSNWQLLKDYVELQRDEYSSEDKEYWHINKILEYIKEIEEGRGKHGAE